MEVNAGIPGIENLGTQTFQPSTIEPQTRKKNAFEAVCHDVANLVTAVNET